MKKIREYEDFTWSHCYAPYFGDRWTVKEFGYRELAARWLNPGEIRSAALSLRERMHEYWFHHPRLWIVSTEPARRESRVVRFVRRIVRQ